MTTRWLCPRCSFMRGTRRPHWCPDTRCPEAERWTRMDWMLNAAAALLLAAVVWGALVVTP